MKVLSIFFCLFTVGAVAQPGEVLNDLMTNHLLTKDASKTVVVSNMVYLPDTVDLPFIDDFSSDRFVPYKASISDTNVSDTLFVKLYDNSNTIPEPYGSVYMIDTTFRIYRDTLPGGTINDSLVPLVSKLIYNYDLSTYPVTGGITEVWPAYDILDSSLMNALDVADTLFESVPDLKQDSLRYYFVHPVKTDSAYLWIDHFACKNDRYPILPPTIGVATFDGVNENGLPYQFGSGGNPHGIADYLTSKPIRFGGSSGSSLVYLSFDYQATGLGNTPEPEDSLVLEFWIPDSARWEHIWSVPGPGPAMDQFEHVHIHLDQPRYRKDGLKIRFKNYASLSGNLDHWHVDFIYLDDLRNAVDTSFDESAIVTPSNGLLRNYTAMPWKHFRWNTLDPLVDTSHVIAFNMNYTNLALIEAPPPPPDPPIPPCDLRVDYKGTNKFTSGLIILQANILPRELYDAAYPMEDTALFDTSLADTMAIFDVKHIFRTAYNDLIETNDTVHFQQVFSNYYAYDDGSAEAAYGPYGGGAQLAYKFEVEQPDSLRSIMIHFSPSVNDVSQKLFRLRVWDNNNGKPGNVIYETPALNGESPVYSNKKNGYVEYFFHNEQRIPVSGTYYIGWVQSDPEVLNIGFDRNIDNSSKIFYNTSGFWTNTSFSGSLMMRPVFVSDLDGLLSVPKQQTTKKSDVTVYPNPTTGMLHFNLVGNPEISVEIYDLHGRMVHNANGHLNKIDMSSLQQGMYLIRITDINSGIASTNRILKR